MTDVLALCGVSCAPAALACPLLSLRPYSPVAFEVTPALLFSGVSRTADSTLLRSPPLFILLLLLLPLAPEWLGEEKKPKVTLLSCRLNQPPDPVSFLALSCAWR